MRLGQFLEAVAERQPAPSGGAMAAVTAAGAAGLVAMVARFSEKLRDGDEVAGRADDLRRRLLELASADAEAYGAVLAACRRPRQPDDEARRNRIRDAMATAADVPLAVAQCAAETGDLAARLASEGNRNLRGDAVTAAHLAEAAARSGAHLVEVNEALGDLGTDRSERAVACCAAVRDAVERMS